MDYDYVGWKEVVLFMTTLQCFTAMLVAAIVSVDKSGTANLLRVALLASGIFSILCCYFSIAW